MYYLVLRPGTGESPSNVDGVLAAYAGTYKKGTVADATELTNIAFEEIKYPQQIFIYLDDGMGRNIPLFKTGYTYS
jgi:hypothetical protein